MEKNLRPLCYNTAMFAGENGKFELEEVSPLLFLSAYTSYTNRRISRVDFSVWFNNLLPIYNEEGKLINLIDGHYNEDYQDTFGEQIVGGYNSPYLDKNAIAMFQKVFTK